MSSSYRPPRHLVVLGHPAADSFNHAVARSYCETVRACGQEAELRDLYALGFDPLLRAEERPSRHGYTPAPDVREELDRLGSSDVVALVYPIWFGLPPAIIKGYVDRVLGAGLGPDSIKEARVSPLLRDKQLVMLSSSATSLPWLEERGQWLALRQAFDQYLTSIFGFCDSEHIHVDSIVSASSTGYVEQCLTDVRVRTRALCARVQAKRRGYDASRSRELR